MSDLLLTGVTVRRRDRTALADASVRFARGRLTAVIGPNGAGKSTLLAAAAGLLPLAAGSVALGGEPLTRLDRRSLARRRAYLPQNPSIDWPIAVERVVALGLTPHLSAFGSLPREAQAAIDTALARHDLAALRHRPATELSGGELARVMLARATVGAPELLLADEPTAGLDPRHALAAAAALRALADTGCTVVAALHDLNLALRIADDVVAVKDGRVIAAGDASIVTDVLLGGLYDVTARITRDQAGVSVRFA